MSNSTTSVDTSTTAPPSSSTTFIDTTSTTPLPTTASPTTISSTSDSTSAPASTTASSTPSTSTTSTSTPTVAHTTTFVSTIASSDGHPGSTVFVTRTSTESAPIASSTGTLSSTPTSSAGLAGASDGSKSSNGGGLSTGGKAAIAVVIPIFVVAALIAGGIWWWRRRRANKDAEDLRRKEVEEYGYNPNDDPNLPVGGVAGGPHDGPYEMVEDGTSGYRGWGNTAAGSSARKASTTISGGASQGIASRAYSESTSPTLNNGPDNRSGDPLMSGSPTHPTMDDGGEILGAMGPASSNNRGEVQRGPSNASSSYSAANRSDGSGEVPLPGGAIGQANYYNEYAGGNGGGPYNEGGYGNNIGGNAGGQPVIRDVQAKRNTRIEHPSHFPQQGGISQNF